MAKEKKQSSPLPHHGRRATPRTNVNPTFEIGGALRGAPTSKLCAKTALPHCWRSGSIHAHHMRRACSPQRSSHHRSDARPRSGSTGGRSVTEEIRRISRYT